MNTSDDTKTYLIELELTEEQATDLYDFIPLILDDCEEIRQSMEEQMEHHLEMELKDQWATLKEELQ